MSGEAVTWAAVTTAVVSLISILTFWTRYSDRITKAESKAEVAEQAAHAASILAQALQVKLEGVQKEFADYREDAALKFVSDRDLVQIENRFSSLVENIQHDIRGMAERLDRVLDQRGA